MLRPGSAASAATAAASGRPPSRGCRSPLDFGDDFRRSTGKPGSAGLPRAAARRLRYHRRQRGARRAAEGYALAAKLAAGVTSLARKSSTEQHMTASSRPTASAVRDWPLAHAAAHVLMKELPAEAWACHFAAPHGPPNNFSYEIAARWGCASLLSLKSGASRRPVDAARWHVHGNRGLPHLIGDPPVSLGRFHLARGHCRRPSFLLGFSV